MPEKETEPYYMNGSAHALKDNRFDMLCKQWIDYLTQSHKKYRQSIHNGSVTLQEADEPNTAWCEWNLRGIYRVDPQITDNKWSMSCGHMICLFVAKHVWKRCMDSNQTHATTIDKIRFDPNQSLRRAIRLIRRI
eukprot:685144_1